MKISLVCSKFRYGGGIERYIIDLVTGFHEKIFFQMFILPSLIKIY